MKQYFPVLLYFTLTGEGNNREWLFIAVIISWWAEDGFAGYENIVLDDNIYSSDTLVGYDNVDEVFWAREVLKCPPVNGMSLTGN